MTALLTSFSLNTTSHKPSTPFGSPFFARSKVDGYPVPHALEIFTDTATWSPTGLLRVGKSWDLVRRVRLDGTVQNTLVITVALFICKNLCVYPHLVLYTPLYPTAVL
jgi:hypothetical protein